MPSDFPRNDLQRVWQNQPTEVCKMSVDNLRRKAQQHDRKARSAVLFAAAIAVLLFLWFGWGVLSFPGKFQNFALGPLEAWSMRLGFAILSLWSLYSGYATYKVFWPNAAASDADLKTTLQSYRQQLEKSRDYLQHIWLRAGLNFCFLGMAMIVVPMVVRDITTPLRMLASLGPIFALLILWLAIFIPRRMRRQRTLQQEIDQLPTLESGYQA
jgi:hypothetical protein